MSPRNAHDVTARAEARNRGLRRVRNSTGLIAVASTAGVVILAGGYAHAAPGKTGTAAKAATTASVRALPRAAANHPASATSRPPTAGAPKQMQQMQQAQPAQPVQPVHTTPPPAATPAPSLKAPVQPPAAAPNNAPSQATSGGS